MENIKRVCSKHLLATPYIYIVVYFVKHVMLGVTIIMYQKTSIVM